MKTQKKINLGNVSNNLKDTQGIIRFQAVQNELNKIELYVEIDKDIYSYKIEQKFFHISISYVDDIPVERSGKFRVVKNNVKHLV